MDVYPIFIIISRNFHLIGDNSHKIITYTSAKLTALISPIVRICLLIYYAHRKLKPWTAIDNIKHIHGTVADKEPPDEMSVHDEDLFSWKALLFVSI